MKAQCKKLWTQDELRSAMLLYAVTDTAWLNARTLRGCVEDAVRGGVTFIQLRDKQASTQQLVAQAKELMPLCEAAGIPFVINDDLDAARMAGADGVHVGQNDAACAEARRVLGPQAIVGVSVQTLQQALDAQADGASYLGVGAMFSTATKGDAEIVALEELAAICEAVSIPVVAIGGLNKETVGSLARTGVDGAAVVSAVFSADDIVEATASLAERMRSVVAP